MEPHDIRIFATATEFREWLEANHDTATEQWVGLYRKGVPKPSMTYAEAVDEALCFGWIDGQVRRVDGELRAQRFTPRRRGSSWSAINIAKVAALDAAGRMQPAGLRAFEGRDRARDAGYSYERAPQELPADWLARFRTDVRAWAYWESETPSYRRTATHWVLSAKREETRERRFATLVHDAAAGRRVKPFLVTRTET